MLSCYMNISKTNHQASRGGETAGSLWLTERRRVLSKVQDRSVCAFPVHSPSSVKQKQGNKTCKSSWLTYLPEKEGLFSKAQRKLLQDPNWHFHQFLFSLVRELKLRTVFKNYLISRGSKITSVKGQMEAWRHRLIEKEERIEKAASWWYVKSSHFLRDARLKSGISTSSIRWHFLKKGRDLQIGWSCCSGRSWHSQRPPAAGWTAG